MPPIGTTRRLPSRQTKPTSPGSCRSAYLVEGLFDHILTGATALATLDEGNQARGRNGEG